MSKHYIGVDLGGTNLRCALYDAEHRRLARTERPTAAAEGSDAVVDRIVQGIADVIAEARLAAADVAAAAIGVPGPLDQENGVVCSTPNMPGWENMPLVALVAERTGVPIFIENDANCAGWGEFIAGAGRGCRHMLMVTLGTGIGGALIIDGKLHLGHDGTAGELGHVCIVDGGRPCGCGGYGCIEAYASASSVARRFRECLDLGWQSSLSGMRDVTCKQIFDAARENDPLARKIVEETGHYLGVMASSVAELINPDRCIIAGGMMKAGDILFDRVRSTCRKRNKHPSRFMEIVPAELGSEAGLVGAADWARLKADAASLSPSRPAPREFVAR